MQVCVTTKVLDGGVLPPEGKLNHAKMGDLQHMQRLGLGSPRACRSPEPFRRAVTDHKFSGGVAGEELFHAYAQDFDKALVRFVTRNGTTAGSPRDGGTMLDVLSWSKAFEDILKLHGFKGKPVALRCSNLETDVGGSLLEGEELPWVKTNDGKRVLHAEIVVDGTDEEAAGVRVLPVLLAQVASLTGDGVYCAWVVGESAYLNLCPPRDGVWLWFPIANTELINDDLWEQLGYSRRTTPVYPPHLPASWTSLIDPNSLQQALNNFQVMECTHGAVPYDLRVLYRKVNEDASVCLRCQGAPVMWSSSGKVLAMMGCHTDVSAENRDHLTKISFIGKISHEIRTPLNAMCGAYDMLSEHMASAPPMTRDAWAMLSAATAQVRMVVDDVLDYSALSAGKMALRKASASLAEMLQEVVRLHSSAAGAKSITLTLAPLPEHAPINVLVDRARMQQVLSNLLSNSIKFTPPGGSVTIVVSTIPNRLTSSMVYFNIDVVDTGRGIPRVHWESVFEDFNQARLGDSCVGTGLGLAICSMLIGLHGGKIFVHDSQAGKGSTFRIQMETPVEVARSASSPRKSGPKPKQDNKQIPLGRVLLVDDTKTNIIVIKALLKKVDPKVEILVADNGKTAVSLALENDVDFVFMDIHMPVLDGIEATKYILAKKPELTVIGLTANTDAELDILCRQVGMREVLLKPTTRPILVRTIAWMMSASNHSAPPTRAKSEHTYREHPEEEEGEDGNGRRSSAN